MRRRLRLRTLKPWRFSRSFKNATIKMQARHLALNKSHDIPATQPRKREPSIAKTLFEKIPDERYVSGDRRAGQAACFAQVLLVCLYITLSRSCLRCRYLLAGKHTLTAQEINERSERGSITPTRSHVSSVISQIRHRVLRADAV